MHQERTRPNIDVEISSSHRKNFSIPKSTNFSSLLVVMLSLWFTHLGSMQHVPLESNPSRCVSRVPYARTTHNEKILVLWICLGAVGSLHYTSTPNSQPGAFLNSSNRIGTVTKEQLWRDEITATVPAGWLLECSTYHQKMLWKLVSRKCSRLEACRTLSSRYGWNGSESLNHCRSTCFTEVNAVSCVGCVERDGCGWA